MIEIDTADAATDWTAVLDLLHRAFAVMEGRIDPPSSLYTHDEMSLAELAAEGLCLLANVDDAPIGCLFCSPREDALYVGKLAVDPDHQGEGIGRALLDAAENAARAASLPALELQTRVEMTENHAAFTAMGFVLAGETAHPGYDRPTSITMRREL